MNNGICVGGPLDGKKLAYPKLRYVLAMEPKKFAKVALGGRDCDIMEIKFQHYEFEAIPELDMGIWVFQDMTLNDALRKIFESYGSVVEKIVTLDGGDDSGEE